MHSSSSFDSSCSLPSSSSSSSNLDLPSSGRLNDFLRDLRPPPRAGASPSVFTSPTLQKGGLVAIQQINLQHSTLATANLAFIFSKNPSIFLVQEPWVYKGRFSGLPTGISIYFKPVPDNVSPRAAIVAPTSTPLHMLEQFSGRDSVTCSWSVGSALFPHQAVFLISSYWDIRSASPPPEMLASIDFCISQGIPYICALDSNAHSTLWGSPSNNHRGDLLEELISSRNMSIQNRGNIPTFHTSRAKSHIDITLSSQDIDPLFAIGKSLLTFPLVITDSSTSI